MPLTIVRDSVNCKYVNRATYSSNTRVHIHFPCARVCIDDACM